VAVAYGRWFHTTFTTTTPSGVFIH